MFKIDFCSYLSKVDKKNCYCHQNECISTFILHVITQISGCHVIRHNNHGLSLGREGAWDRAWDNLSFEAQRTFLKTTKYEQVPVNKTTNTSENIFLVNSGVDYMTFQGVEELVGEFVFLNLLHPPPPPTKIK